MITEQPAAECNKSHRLLYPGLEQAIENRKSHFLSIEQSSSMTYEEVCDILEDVASFPFGRYILLAGGSNGMWTDYLISPQEYLTAKNPTGLNLSVIERFFLFSSPTVLAQRELHATSRQIAQSLIGEGKTFASIPCGLMRDLLSLDYSGTKNMSLVGIDIDPESIERSKGLASDMQIDHVTYLQRDAWNLQEKNAFDFISCIGLNEYENDRERVVDLYRNFYDALKPGGVLFTGVLTWPPYIDPKKSDWNLSLIPKYDLRLEAGIHKDILNIQWLNFRTLAEIKEDFIKAGFKNVEIKPDARCVFPAIIATK